MPALATPLRKDLEKAVIQARRVAERGAAAALIALAYADGSSDHLSREDAALRTALRARGRQLGEAKGDEGVLKGQRALEGEIAYEQWHRMLFARFLAENGLLRHPEGAAVTIEMCAELAPDEGARDGWDLAARYAGAMLPGLFRASDPAVRVRLAREHYEALERLVEGLHDDVFTSDDGLGWVYQFWQTERKKEVNAEAKSRGTKIGAAELPAVTQLFTEPYMVDFLLQNTLGAWWAGKYPDSPLLAEMPYLRWLDEAAGDGGQDRGESGGDLAMNGLAEGQRSALTPSTAASSRAWSAVAQLGDSSPGQPGHPARRPAAGTFDGWAKTVAELKVLDPCCGSGHFLVAAFRWLRRMREEEEGLSEADAADAVLRDNLFGLELDRRCTQIAMFNVALAAWRVGGHPERNVPQVACSGTPVKGNAEEWAALARTRDAWDAPGQAEFIQAVYREFSEAPVLGSLIDPKALRRANANNLRPRNEEALTALLHRALDKFGQMDDDFGLFAESAEEVARAWTLLDWRYDLVVTNVPYLSRGSQDPVLRVHAERRHGAARTDLATVFLDRCLSLGDRGGTIAAVVPQNWLFLGAYTDLRKDLLVASCFDFIARLGPGAFGQITGTVVSVALIAISQVTPSVGSRFLALDLQVDSSPENKQLGLVRQQPMMVGQAQQENNPDARIVFSAGSTLPLLGEYAHSLHGQGTFDDPRFVCRWWELESLGRIWELQQTTGSSKSLISGLTNAIRWQGGRGELYDLIQQMRQGGYSSGKWRAGTSVWGKSGVLIGGMDKLYVSRYMGRSFGENVSAIIPFEQSHESAILAFVEDVDFQPKLRLIDAKPKVTSNTFAKVPFDLDYWTKVAQEKYPNGLPEPHSDDPTQWLFTGHPKGSNDPLHVALARLLGYRWPDQPADDHGLRDLCDPDGIVCLVAVAGEQPAHLRLRDLLRAAWGDDWTGETVGELVAGAGAPGRALEDWLRDDAFKQHCALFHNRPFLWHVWDGRKDGFSAIVNYHRLDAALLDKLTYTYLGDWIGRQREAAAANVAGADARWKAALALQEKLELIRRGEAPYDVYVRWKPLHRQPIGWEPDLDDGVRLNVRPFIEAGVLRSKFTVKWGKDRGANPVGADVHRWSEAAQRAAVNRPDEIDGALRLNDLHLSLATKRAAREAHAANPAADVAPRAPGQLPGVDASSKRTT